jgi:hypothetical protein
VTWLNSVSKAGEAGWEVAAINLTYGNETSMAWHYSHAVILIEVPKRGARDMAAAAENTSIGGQETTSLKRRRD